MPPVHRVVVAGGTLGAKFPLHNCKGIRQSCEPLLNGVRRRRDRVLLINIGEMEMLGRGGQGIAYVTTPPWGLHGRGKAVQERILLCPKRLARI